MYACSNESNSPLNDDAATLDEALATEDWRGVLKYIYIYVYIYIYIYVNMYIYIKKYKVGGAHGRADGSPD